MNYRFKYTTIKLLEVNISADAWDLGLEEDFSDMTQKA